MTRWVWYNRGWWNWDQHYAKLGTRGGSFRNHGILKDNYTLADWAARRPFPD